MKDLTILFVILSVFFALLIGSQAQAFDSDSDDELVCAKLEPYDSRAGKAISCVSKASIEKDKAELKLIKLQIKKLEAETKVDAEVKKAEKTTK